ncbi:MAG: DUF4835 family protein [Flavobacteriales bacterium]|nr:DUF4835 family protein [Flavobacteriales bacterium]
MRKTFLHLAYLLLPVSAFAQEFNCQVTVVAPQIAAADPRLWKNMETSIVEFMNTRRFTNFNYTSAERLDMSLLLTISEQPTADRFKGTLQVIYARPVFNTDYSSTVINLLDNDVEFQYLQNTQIDFIPERFTNNLSSILAFYAYYILGVHADTYALNGGTDFYNLAQEIVSQAQNTAEPGWKAFEGNKNRYWLIDNQIQAVFRPLRELLYNYHRLGMDAAHDDVATARKTIAAAIEKLKTVHQAKPASYNLQVLFNAKGDELVELFKPAEPQEKAKLFNTLQIVDPGNISKYQAMMRGS